MHSWGLKDTVISNRIYVIAFIARCMQSGKEVSKHLEEIRLQKPYFDMHRGKH